jgi:c-di-GMP-binding flagellar brake protein YcgR
MNKGKTVNHPQDMVNLWERLELRLVQNKETASFVTRIEDIDKEALLVERPVRISGQADITIGQNLEAVFNRADASYTFDVVVTSIDTKRENITTIQAVSSVRRSQRRRFVRIEIAGDVNYKIIDTSGIEQAGLSLDKKGELLNISAGGVLLSAGRDLKQGDLVLLNFSLKNKQRLENIIGLVKRLEKSGSAESTKQGFLAGIEFLTKDKIAHVLARSLSEYFPSEVNFFDEALQQTVVQFIHRQRIENSKNQNVGR